jgi:hypothetical protein
LLDYLNAEASDPDETLLSYAMGFEDERAEAASECLSMLATTIRRLAIQAST